MAPRYGPTPSRLRTTAAVVGSLAAALSSWYWNSSSIGVDRLFQAAVMGVVKVALIAACIVLLCSCASFFLPRGRASVDPFWLMRNLGGPLIAFAALVALVTVPVVASALGPVSLLLLLGLPLWLGAVINAARLGAAYQFRLGEAHPSLASVCILATGAFGLVEALTKTAVTGHEFDPLVVWLLVTFVGPVATIGLALWDLRIHTPRVDRLTMVALAAVMAMLAGVVGHLAGWHEGGRPDVADKASGTSSSTPTPESIASTLTRSGFVDGPNCESRGTVVYRAVTDPDPEKGGNGSRFVICDAGESLWYQGQRLSRSVGGYMPADRTPRGYRATLRSEGATATYECFFDANPLFVVTTMNSRLEERVIWSSTGPA
ncbi:hypothetical protein ACLQ3K_18195 [Tsukamurella sp. DT100]|uniref:hypothetical protein n=1 Tax=Tsukamurella sp. DT100 TaxID=3393415 RepID=UPI003CF20B61